MKSLHCALASSGNKQDFPLRYKLKFFAQLAVGLQPLVMSIWQSCFLHLFLLLTQPLEEDISMSEEPAPMYRLVLAGDAGAGKSSFLLRLTLNEFKGDIQTTLGGCHFQRMYLWLEEVATPTSNF